MWKTMVGQLSGEKPPRLLKVVVPKRKYGDKKLCCVCRVEFSPRAPNQLTCGKAECTAKRTKQRREDRQRSQVC